MSKKELSKLLSKLNKRIRRMSKSGSKTQAYHKLQRKNAAFVVERNGVRQLSQKGLSDRDYKKLVDYATWYDTRNTVREQKKKREEIIEDINELTDNDVLTRVNDEDFWKFYNRIDDSVSGMYSSDEVLTYSTKSYGKGKNSQQVIDAITKCFENDKANILNTKELKHIEDYRRNHKKEGFIG